MRRARSLIERLDVLAQLHQAALVGAAVGLASEVYHTDGETKVLIGLAVTVAVRQIADRAVGGKRSECERAIAATVRSILDRHLDLTRFDAVGFGDYLTLRHLAAAAREGQLRKLISYGGPAQTLSRVIGELVSELEDEVGRCYPRLRPRGQTRVDAFAAALRSAVAAGDVMVNSPPFERWAAEDARRFSDLTRALLAIDTTGNDLDATFDTKGSRAAAEERATSAAEKQRVEGHAAAVLLKNAREAAQILQLPSVQQAIPIVELSELLERLRRAREIMLNVDGTEFGAATNNARAAHRRLNQEDIGEALDAAIRISEGRTQDDPEAVMRERLDRFPTDLAALEAIRDGQPPPA